jgi:site-specific DNA recombinase
MATRPGGRAALYGRISRDKNDGGETVGEQIRLSRKLAEEHELDVVAEYREKDGTGASEKSKAKERPEYEAMLAAAAAGEFDTIVAYSDDRITRRPIELERLIDLAEKHKLHFLTVRTALYDLSTDAGIMQARVLQAFAANEVRNISARQKVIFRRNAFEGKPKLQRQRPFGWETDGVTIRLAEAEQIRHGIEMVKRGASIGQVQNDWNSKGILNSAGNEWEWLTVRRVLTGWRTAGVRTYQREPVRTEEGNLVMGAWEPIISLEERNQALGMLGRLSQKKLRTGSWPLAGLLVCGLCAKPLYGQLPSGTRSRALYGCKKGHLAISAGLLEQYLIQLVAERAYRNQRQKVEEYHPVIAEDLPEYEVIRTHRRKSKELMDAYDEGVLPQEIAFPRSTEHTRLADRLEADMNAFIAAQSAPPSPLQRSSDALEGLLEMQGQFLRVTPKTASSHGVPFGEEPSEAERSNSWTAVSGSSASPGREQELPFNASDEETGELNRLLRGELQWVGIRKGKAGRQSAEQFASRVDPLWR